MSAEVRAGVRGGFFAGGANDAVGTLELDLRGGNWALTPAYDLIRGGYDLHAVHVDVRHAFDTPRALLWVGVGPTFVGSNASASKTTWNADAVVEWKTSGALRPFVSARYYSFKMDVFRDTLEEHGAVVSVGVSVRLH